MFTYTTLEGKHMRKECLEKENEYMILIIKLLKKMENDNSKLKRIYSFANKVFVGRGEN